MYEAEVMSRRLRSGRIRDVADAQEKIVKGVSDVVHEVLRNVSASPTAESRADRSQSSSKLIIVT